MQNDQRYTSRMRIILLAVALSAACVTDATDGQASIARTHCGEAPLPPGYVIETSPDGQTVTMNIEWWNKVKAFEASVVDFDFCLVDAYGEYENSLPTSNIQTATERR